MSDSSLPNYPELVKYLVSPFIEAPDALKMDCETYGENPKLWIRLALDESDKGRLIGPNGRHIQAIRRVVEIAAKPSGDRVQVEVYGTQRESRPPREGRSSGSTPRPKPRRNNSR